MYTLSSGVYRIIFSSKQEASYSKQKKMQLHSRRRHAADLPSSSFVLWKQPRSSINRQPSIPAHLYIKGKLEYPSLEWNIAMIDGLVIGSPYPPPTPTNTHTEVCVLGVRSEHYLVEWSDLVHIFPSGKALWVDEASQLSVCGSLIS